MYHSNDTIYRFSIDADANLTTDTNQTMAAMGLTGANQWFQFNAANYDPSDASVILCAYYGSAASGRTPTIGKWLCSNWPFTAGNAVWLSAMQQRWGGFTSGQFTNHGTAYLNTTTDKLYLCSVNAGQIVTLDATDGSVLGSFEPDPVYRATNPFLIAGCNASNLPVASGYLASEGSGDLAVWDDSNPSAWTKSTVVLPSSKSTTVGIPFHGRNQASGYMNRNRMVPMGDYERGLLGLPDMAWRSCNREQAWGETYLHTYDFTTSTHSHRPVAHAGDRRGIGNARGHLFASRVIEISGVPWWVSEAQHSYDIEDENPGIDYDTCRGLVFTPLGPGTVTYTVTATADSAPKRLEIGVDYTASDYLFSDSPAKHKFRFKVNAGSFSDWRSGTRQLQALDSTVDGLAAWPSYSNGDTLTIEHSMCSGWPVSFAPTKCNPGGVGDPTPIDIHSADVGPPREVRAALIVDASEPGGGLL
jgi:hypothetical protein